MSISVRIIKAGLRAWSALLPSAASDWLLDKFLTPKPWKKPFDEPAGEKTHLGSEAVLWSDKQGERDALLIHGWSGHRSQFDAIANMLRELGYRVHLLDPPGHGAAGGRRSNPGRFVEAIRLAADHAGPFELVIGHSMGGMSLMHLLTGDQPRLAQKAAVIASPSVVEYTIRQTARQANLGAQATEIFVEKVVNEAGIGLAGFNIPERAAEAVAPLLIIHDRDDPQIPLSGAQTLHNAWPGSELFVTEGHGHNRILAAGETLDKLKTMAW